MRIGVIGAGHVAGFGHGPAIQRVSGIELAAAYDPVLERAQRLVQDHPGALATDQEDQFWNAGLDAVTICSPVHAHLPNVKSAVQHGLPILCEKPLAFSDEESREIIAITTEAKVPLAVGFVYRFSPVAQQIRTWVADGLIGEIRSLRLVYIWDLHGEWVQDAARKWIRSPLYVGRMEEGGPMVDCGVHQVDLARWWLQDEIVSVVGHGAWVGDYEAPDHVYAHLRHESGCHTMVEMSFSFNHTAREPWDVFSYDLIGTGGTIHYSREGWRFVLRNGDQTLVAPGASEKNFDGMYEAWRDAFRSGDYSNLPTGEDGRLAVAITRDATDQAIAARPRHSKVTAGAIG